MPRFIPLICLLLYWLPSVLCAQPSVLFLNPGKPSETFWRNADSVAKGAAKNLSLDLITFHAQRDPYRMVKEIEKRIETNQLPQYVIAVNVKNVLPKILHLLENKSTFVIVIIDGLNNQQHYESNQNPHWKTYLLGSLIPNHHAAGFETAKAMLAAANNQAGDLVMIAGKKGMPISLARETGARDFFKTQKHINLKRIVYGDWQIENGYQKTNALFERYPKLKYIWSANDRMAFGSLQAIHERGLHPGKDVFISAINTSPKALSLRKSGQISALAGSHFMAAGIAMMMIRAHIDGNELPTYNNDNLSRLIDPNSLFFEYLSNGDWSQFSFETFYSNQGSAIIAD